MLPTQLSYELYPTKELVFKLTNPSAPHALFMDMISASSEDTGAGHVFMAITNNPASFPTSGPGFHNLNVNGLYGDMLPTDEGVWVRLRADGTARVMVRLFSMTNFERIRTYEQDSAP